MEEYLPGPDEQDTPGLQYSENSRQTSQLTTEGDLRSVSSKLRRSFNSILQASSSVAGESFTFFETRRRPQRGMKRLKVDICMYPHTEQAAALYRVKSSAIKARTVFSRIELPVFVELDWNRSPFTFDHRTVSFTDTELGEQNRTRLARCIGEMLLSQHRQFVFALWIQQDWMRLMLWDRSGVVFSSAVNYIEDPLPLLQFLRRFANATPAQRGHDPSVSFATGPEIEMLLSYEPKNRWERAYHAEMTQDLNHYPIRKVACEGIESGDESSPQSYLIGRHRYGEHEPIGRGTRCYVAYDIDQCRLVFLKDFWHNSHSTPQSELDVYELLMDAGVRNIAVAIAGGHVGVESPQQTRPPLLSSVRLHDRVVFETLGRPLESHKDQAELICVVRDAFIAHSDAYHKAGILHADISPANILIDIHTGKGFLNDWHLCRHTDADPGPADEDTRAGTWMTMSARLLTDPYSQNSLFDDLESFFHTLSLIRLRFYPHDLSPHPGLGLNRRYRVDVAFNAHNLYLSNHLASVYYAGASRWDGGPLIGGYAKRSCIGADKDVVHMPACPLATLLNRLRRLFSQYYWPSNGPEGVVPKDLQDHRAMLRIFNGFVQHTKCSVAKTKDQFEGLCTPEGKPYPQSSWDGSRQRTRPIPLCDEEDGEAVLVLDPQSS